VRRREGRDEPQYVGKWAHTYEVPRSSTYRRLGVNRNWLTRGQTDAIDPVCTENLNSGVVVMETAKDYA
jgi:hypothetical protein